MIKSILNRLNPGPENRGYAVSIRNRSVAQKRDCFGLSRAAPLIDVNGTFKPFTIEHKMAAARYHKHTGKQYWTWE